MDCQARRKQAGAALLASNVDALLVTNLADIRYLTGFSGSAGVLVLGGTGSVLFTDGRYTTQAREQARGMRVVIARTAAIVAACEWIAAEGLRRCGFDPNNTTVAMLETMRKAGRSTVRGGIFKPAATSIGRQREIKDEREVAALRSAAQLGCELFDGILQRMHPGATEMEVALELEFQARSAGAERMSFETIVASGERSALPHGKASRAPLPKRGFVTLDFGVVLDGYCSDMTRTAHLGRLGPEERRVYDSVLEAQIAAIDAIGPGVTAASVDGAARGVLKGAGLARYFTHSTGHGVGLEIHEGPRLAAKQEQVLAAGMVVTVEPGVYLPGKFGVRIEDMVLVTETGSEVLTPSTKICIEL